MIGRYGWGRARWNRPPWTTTATCPGSCANASAKRSRVPSSSSSTPTTSSASSSSWRALKFGLVVSTQLSSAVTLDLVGLLVGGPVDPRDQRLRDRAERAEPHRVPAPLVAGLARGVAGVDLGRRLGDRLHERGLQRGPAARAAAVAAVAQPIVGLEALAQQRAEVLVHIAVPAVLPRRTQVVAVVVGIVAEGVGGGELVEESLSETRLELGLQPQGPP